MEKKYSYSFLSKLDRMDVEIIIKYGSKGGGL